MFILFRPDLRYTLRQRGKANTLTSLPIDYPLIDAHETRKFGYCQYTSTAYIQQLGSHPTFIFGFLSLALLLLLVVVVPPPQYINYYSCILLSYIKPNLRRAAH